MQNFKHMSHSDKIFTVIVFIILMARRSHRKKLAAMYPDGIIPVKAKKARRSRRDRSEPPYVINNYPPQNPNAPIPGAQPQNPNTPIPGAQPQNPNTPIPGVPSQTERDDT